jgi:hypothetical protein
MRFRKGLTMWLAVASVLVIAGSAAAITEPGFLFTQTFAPVNTAVVSPNCNILDAVSNWNYSPPGPSNPSAQEFFIFTCGGQVPAINVNQPGVRVNAIFDPPPTELGYSPTEYVVPTTGVNFVGSNCAILEGAVSMVGSITFPTGGGWDYCLGVAHPYSTSLGSFEVSWLQ